jgi:hypothetical protein
MSIPAFTAEASLYKSPGLYRGRSGRKKVGAALNVEAAFGACELLCELTQKLAVYECIAEYVWWNPFGLLECLNNAQSEETACISDCTSGAAAAVSQGLAVVQGAHFAPEIVLAETSEE